MKEASSEVHNMFKEIFILEEELTEVDLGVVRGQGGAGGDSRWN